MNRWCVPVLLLLTLSGCARIARYNPGVVQPAAPAREMPRVAPACRLVLTNGDTLQIETGSTFQGEALMVVHQGQPDTLTVDQLQAIIVSDPPAHWSWDRGAAIGAAGGAGVGFVFGGVVGTLFQGHVGRAALFGGFIFAPIGAVIGSVMGGIAGGLMSTPPVQVPPDHVYDLSQLHGSRKLERVRRILQP